MHNMKNQWLATYLHPLDLTDKDQRAQDYYIYMMIRNQTMFDWKGLPKTIPQRVLEMMLQTQGNVCVFEYEGKLYATFGGLGGEPDYNYEPTIYTIANPALDYSAELKIGTECVRLRNDSVGYGLYDLNMRYATMMMENDISMLLLDYNYRIGNLLGADNDRTYESAKQFITDIIDGRLGVIAESEFFEGISDASKRGQHYSIQDLIEYHQYLKASWFNELGVNSNYNMKRERIAAPEAQMTDDALLPLIDQMLEQRRIGAEEVNEMFGVEWSVDLAGAWLKEHMKQSVQGVDFDTDDDENIDEKENVDNVDKPVDNVSDDMDNSTYNRTDSTGPDMADETDNEKSDSVDEQEEVLDESTEDTKVSVDKQVEINVEINVDATEDQQDDPEDQPEVVEQEDNEDEEDEETAD